MKIFFKSNLTPAVDLSWGWETLPREGQIISVAQVAAPMPGQSHY